MLDFTVDSRGVYKKNDLEKLHQRIINEAQTATATFVQSLTLKDAMRAAKAIEVNIVAGLAASQAIALLGIEVLGVNILAVKATPEMGPGPGNRNPGEAPAGGRTRPSSSAATSPWSRSAKSRRAS